MDVRGRHDHVVVVVLHSDHPLGQAAQVMVEDVGQGGDQANSDQFRQYDDRYVLGASAKTTISGAYLGKSTEDAFGIQLRNDVVTTELDHTRARTIVEDYRHDRSTINTVGLYWANAIVWTPWLRTEAGCGSTPSATIWTATHRPIRARPACCATRPRSG
jgi:hypothetical protein